MKVFFIASARTEDLEVNQKMYQIVKDLGCEHTSDFMVSTDFNTFYNADEKDWGQRYQARVKEIAKAEVCIFECSMHSLAMGQLVQEALRREKPVIVLHNISFTPHFLTGTGEAEKKLQTLEYNETDLSEIIKYGLEEARELLNVRFTMLLSPEYVSYLDHINETEGISRSEYIRNLIDEDKKRKGV